MEQYPGRGLTGDEVMAIFRHDHPEVAAAMDELHDAAEVIGQLRLRRKELGLTQQQLAERLGVSQQRVAALLQFSGNPQLSSLLQLVDALEMEFRLVPKSASSKAVAPAS